MKARNYLFGNVCITRLLLALVCLLLPGIVRAQEAPQNVDQSAERVYTMDEVDVKPEFPGGDEGMYKWLGENIQYPASTSNPQGRVVAAFDIEKDGSITNVRIIEPRDPLLNKEVIRLIKAMPDWTPGYINGSPVTCTYVLPCTFKIQD